MMRYSLLALAGFLFAFTQSSFSQESATRFILSGPDPLALKKQVEHFGGKVLERLHYQSGWIVELTKPQALELHALLALRSQHADAPAENSEAEEILEQDREVHLIDAMQPAIVWNDSTLTASQRTPWGIQAIHAPEAFDTSRGKSATVCIIDTGIQKNHPDLRGGVDGGESTRPGHWGDDDESYADDNGHGTHVAGTIAARDNGIGVVGVAPEARLFIVKALDARGSGTFSSLSEGIRSCMAHHAQVINLSLASTDESATITRAVDVALKAGIVIVAAAGNSHGPVEYPAKLPGVIAVSAISKEFKISYFSSRGPEISFSAPGEEVLSTYPGGRYAMMEGTSQATPHVAGVAALLFSAGVTDVAKHLQARDLSLSHELQGAGCIDAELSVRDSGLATAVD